jgi:hypothetical protein
MKVKDFIDAIEKNGLPQARSMYWADREGTGTADLAEVKSACAIGMGAYNLKLDPFTVQFWGKGEIMRWNDLDHLSFQEIADRYRGLYSDSLENDLKGISAE